MRFHLLRTLAVLAAFLVFSGGIARADLTHRYSFTTDASDSVGHANGTAVGGVTFSGGSVVIDNLSGDYLELPGGLISGYTNLTVEFWGSFFDNGNWSRVFDFGDTNGSVGRNYVFFSPHSGAGDYRMSYADADPGYNHELVVVGSGTLDNLGPIHVACVWDPPNSFMGLYTNGVLVASRNDLNFPLSSISNVYSWIGRSLYSSDSPLNGTIDEFRIYNSALSPVEIAGSFASGPDTVGNDPGALAALRISFKTPLVKGSGTQAQVSADFDKVKGVLLSGASGVIFKSLKTNIATIDTNGVITAVGVGSTTISASYGGKLASQLVNISSGQPAVLRHRYSFAADGADSVGSATGTLQNGATVTGGALALDGTGGYVELPANLFTNYDSVTFEAWVTDNGSKGWARIWDFGNSTGGAGQQGGGTKYMFLSLPSGNGNLRGAYTITGGGSGEQIVEWLGGRPAVGQKVHVAWTTDASFRTGKLYVDGRLVGINTNLTLTPRDLGPTVNNWLGRSQFNDPAFNGTIDEFRIYDGPLSPLQITLEAAAGPDVVPADPGALQSVSLTAGTNSLILGGLQTQVTLMANFQNQQNVNISSLDGIQLWSSDTNVLTVTKAGIVDGVSVGNAKVFGLYNGQSNSISFTVSLPQGYAKPNLIHRYSFADAAGSTTVKDSAGSADGTLKGNGTFSGSGKLTLPGGAATSNGGYVELPSGLISGLTNATFEAWVQWNGGNDWQRIFDFGNNSNGQGQQGTGTSFIQMTPHAGSTAKLLFEAVDNPNSARSFVDGAAALPSGKLSHVAVVYNYTQGALRLYVNGQLVAVNSLSINLHDIDDTNVWLGRSNWPDPMFRGVFDEFRIYDGPLFDSEIAADYTSGPDALPAGPTPSLSFVINGANAILSWPVSFAGYSVETAVQIQGTPAWTPLGTAPVVNGSQNTVTIPLDGTAKYFRLRK
jgi:Concanavalin A-like lectin/glucanases superfamily